MESDAALAASIGRFDNFEGKDTARLLNMILALGGEVFILKAEVQRLTQALAAKGGCDAADLAAAGRSPELGAWMKREEGAFARALLQAFSTTEEARNVAASMAQD